MPKTLTADALDVIAAAAVYGLTDLKVKFLNVYFGNKKYLCKALNDLSNTLPQITTEVCQ